MVRIENIRQHETGKTLRVSPTSLSCSLPKTLYRYLNMDASPVFHEVALNHVKICFNCGHFHTNIKQTKHCLRVRFRNKKNIFRCVVVEVVSLKDEHNSITARG